MTCVTCLGEGWVLAERKTFLAKRGYIRVRVKCPTCRGTGESPVTAKAADDLAALWRDTGENGGA